MNLAGLIIGSMFGGLFGRRCSCSMPFGGFWGGSRHYSPMTDPFYNPLDTMSFLSVPPRYGKLDYLLNPNFTLWQYMLQKTTENSYLNNPWSQTGDGLQSFYKSSIPGLDSLTIRNDDEDDDKKKEKEKEKEEPTVEESAQNDVLTKKTNKLAALMEHYRNILLSKGNENESNSLVIAKIKAALEKEDVKEKYEELTKIYKELDKKELRKAMMSLAPADPENPQEGEYNFKGMLEKAGYKFGMSGYSDSNKNDSDYVKAMNELYSKIKNYNDANQYCVELEQLIDAMGVDENNEILRVLSTWNDKFNNNNERNIIRFLNKKMKTLDSTGQKATIDKNVKPLADKLVEKATQFKDYSDIFSEEELNKLEKQSKAVTEASANVTLATMNKLVEKFETLYVTLRRMDAKRANHQITNAYDFLNSIADDDVDFVNSNLVTKETEEDLKAEMGDAITTPENEEEEEEGPAPKNAQEHIEKLVKEGILRKTSVEGIYTLANSKVDGNNIGNKTSAHYTIKDGKIVLLKNVTWVSEGNFSANGKNYKYKYRKSNNNKYYYVNDIKTARPEKSSDPGGINYIEVTADHIRGVFNGKKDTPNGYTEKTEGEDLGSEIASLAIKRTDLDEEKRICSILDTKIHADNVTDVLYGYNYTRLTEKNGRGDAGIIQQLSGENGENHPTIGNIRKIIDALITKAETPEFGLSDDKDLEYLQTVIEDIKSGKYDENSQWGSVGWKIFGDKSTSEIIDKHVYALADKIREKEGLKKIPYKETDVKKKEEIRKENSKYSQYGPQW